jgi:KDO2-lipid IV(A) lauroyltransferase
VNKLFFHTVKYLLIGLSILPLRVLYVFSDLIFFVGYYIFRYRRRITRENLMRSFPEMGPEEIGKAGKRFYRHLCDIMAETLKNIGGDAVTITRRVTFSNIQLLRDFHAQNKSVILYTAHYGNWEWLTVLPLYVPFRMIAFYQPLSNSMFDELMKNSREKYGIMAIPSNQAYRALKSHADEGVPTLSLVLGDQSPPSSGPKVWLNFLNQETAFLPGANKIARKLDQVVVYPHFTKTGRGRYKVEMIPIHPGMDDSGEHPIIRNYAGQLEKSIRQDPGLWLWSHRRWKLKPEKI